MWQSHFNPRNYYIEFLPIGAIPGFLRPHLNEDSIRKMKHGLGQCCMLRKRNVPNPTSDAKFIGDLLLKIFCRGYFPVSTLRVEQALVQQLQLDEIVHEYDKKSPHLGWYSSSNIDSNDIVNAAVANWAECSFIPALEKTDKTQLGSVEEDAFLFDWVEKNLGRDAICWFIPQVPLDLLLEANGRDPSPSSARRIDFLLYHPSSDPIAIEIDGREHETQSAVDEKRDQELKQIGIRTVRITNEEIRLGKGPNLDEIKQYWKEIPKFSLDRVEEPIARAAWLASEVAKFQLAVIKGIIYGWLPLEKEVWNVFISCDTPQLQKLLTLAIDDLKELIESASRLHIDHSFRCPDIVIETARKAKPVSFEKKNVDLHIDMRNQECLNSIMMQDISSDILICKIAIPANLAFYPGSATSRRRILDDNFDISEPLLKVFLRHLFRKREFRELQAKAIHRTLLGKDLVTLLPTGAGKSIIYQLASLLTPGIAIVIDPIVALIDDQVENLQKYGIDRAVGIYMDSSDPGMRNRQLSRFERGEFFFILVSPERLQIPKFRGTLRALSELTVVNLAVIDEAHCVSEWGHDFRPAYLNLGQNLREFCRSKDGIEPPLLALSGTASRAVLRDMLTELDMPKNDPDALIRPETFDRSEITFEISKTDSPPDTLRGLLNSMPEKLNKPASSFYKPSGEETNSGIVFSPVVRGAKGVYFLQKLVEKTTATTVVIFTSTSPSKKINWHSWNAIKLDNAQSFKQNSAPILVATKAFGMGIDKPNIRWTIHYGMPNSIEAFYQEAGRAGRDQKPTICAIIFSETSPDRTDEIFSQKNLEAVRAKFKEFNKHNDNISTSLYFHLKSFEGVEEEIELVGRTLNELGNLKSVPPEIPFWDNESDESMKQERTLHRLVKCGILADYEVEHGAKKFRVKLSDYSEGQCKELLLSYIEASQPGMTYRDIIQSVSTTDRSEFALRLCKVLISFTYEVIEQARRRMIYEAVLMGRECRDDQAIRNYILRYLQEGMGAENLQALVDKTSVDFKEWFSLLAKVLTPVEAGELRGTVIRFLESYPFHPGLMVLRGITEALTASHERDEVLISNSLQAAVDNSKNYYGCGEDEINDLIRLLVDYAATDNAPALRIPLLNQLHDLKNKGELFSETVDYIPFSVLKWDQTSQVYWYAMEIQMPLDNALSIAKQICNRYPQTKI